MSLENSPRENGEEREERRAWTSRRRFLEAAGVAGLVGGVGGFAIAQQQSTTYEFAGEVAGWQGQAPAEIEGEANPTLELEAGTEYEVVWENLDGAPHDFVIQDENGEELVGTDVVSEQGATTSLTFTASEEMAQYICTIHPSSMVGSIEIGEGDGATDQQVGQQQGFVPQGPTVGVQRVADGPLTNPVTLRTVPGMQDTHAIADQAGQIYLHYNGELQDEPVLDISDRLAIGTEAEGGFDRAEGFDERGLLGLAFHPEFQQNGQFYLRYSADEQDGDDGLTGPDDREMPEDWDHVEVLAEFQMAGGETGTTVQSGTADDDENATLDGNETGNLTVDETGNQTVNETGNQTQMPAGDGTQIQADPDSERVLLEIPSPQFNHNGGDVTFGPDGYLYATIGDGGDANDTGVGHVEDWYDENEGGNAQNVTDNLLGSVLRVDVDRQGDDTPYAVPDDNPLVDTDGMDEIYAWGLRNPWRMSFNDGTLVAADVGQDLFEEVDVVENGGNYGWNVREGFHCFDAANPTQPPADCPTTVPAEEPFGGQELADPVLEYPHTYQGTSVGISVTGGYVYRGDELPDLAGKYVFGDWSAGFTEPRGRIFVATPGEEVENGDQTDDGTAGNQTGANATTGDDAANVSDGQEGVEDGNVTANNETAGNETAEDGEAMVQVEEEVDLQQPSEQPWPYEEVLIGHGENQEINRFISAFGRDEAGDVYVLASRTGRIEGEPGEVFRLVPEREGEEVSQPEVEVPTPEEEAEDENAKGDDETGDANVTADNETVDANATTDNETVDDNETGT